MTETTFKKAVFIRNKINELERMLSVGFNEVHLTMDYKDSEGETENRTFYLHEDHLTEGDLRGHMIELFKTELIRLKNKFISL